MTICGPKKCGGPVRPHTPKSATVVEQLSVSSNVTQKFVSIVLCHSLTDQLWSP